MTDSQRHTAHAAAPVSGGTLADQIAQNVTTIAALLQQEREETSTPAQRRLELMSRLIGRPSYLLTLLASVIAWVTLNSIATILGMRAIDRPPFQWLQGILTLIAMLTSTTVLIAQNREARLEQQREHLDLQINLLTEQKVTRLISLLEELRCDLPVVRDRHDPHTAQLQEATDTAQVISALKEVGVAGQDLARAGTDKARDGTRDEKQ